MQVKGVLITLLGLAVVSEAAVPSHKTPFSRVLTRRQNNRGGNKNGGNNGGNNNAGNGGGGGTTLNPANVQTGSQQDGNNPGADNQAASAT